MRILTWNIGSFFFLKYAKCWGLKYRGQKILHEYFQPSLNGDFVSRTIKTLRPDILFLQEIYSPDDIGHIEILKEYPYQKLISTWYHEHAILVASKYEFGTTEQSGFTIITCGSILYIPVHLNSFHASKRLDDAALLRTIAKSTPNIIILGDTNIWSRGRNFFFRNDKKAYAALTENLSDFSKEIVSTSYLGLGLDKVFGSKNLKVGTTVSPTLRGYFMDHYLLYIDL